MTKYLSLDLTKNNHPTTKKTTNKNENVAKNKNKSPIAEFKKSWNKSVAKNIMFIPNTCPNSSLIKGLMKGFLTTIIPGPRGPLRFPFLPNLNCGSPAGVGKETLGTCPCDPHAMSFSQAGFKGKMWVPLGIHSRCMMVYIVRVLS